MLAQQIIEKMPLQKTNQMFLGECPYCKSNTFIVDDSKNNFFCFSCKSNGGYDEFTYMLGEPIAPIEIPIDDFKQQVFEANAMLMEEFKQALKCTDVATYIAERKIPESLLVLFDIGFSTSKCYTKLSKYNNEVLLATGAFKLKDGNVVPMFYNRLMFPIYDSMNNIVGWGGRKINMSSAPKYINSPESVMYKKRNILFGMNKAKYNTKSGIIVCEGYMDVASLHNSGFNNAVASLGTALTLEQLEMIRYYTKELYLCYDNDDAGHKAVKRAIQIAKQLDFNIHIIVLSEYKDADEYIKNDIEAFKNCIKNAEDVETFLKNNSDSFTSEELLNMLIEKATD